MRANESSRAMNLAHLSQVRLGEPDVRVRNRNNRCGVVGEKFRSFSFDYHHYHSDHVKKQEPQEQPKDDNQDLPLEATRKQNDIMNLKSQQVSVKSSKSLKTYHPIIRLFGVFRLCIQLATFLLIVPSELICQVAKQKEPQFGSQNDNTTTVHLDLNSPHQSSHLNHQLNQQSSIPSNWTSRLASIIEAAHQPNQLGASRGQHLALESAPLLTRQTLLSSLVSQQSQKILKNLVNTTIADLVAQTANRKVNLTRQVQQQQQQLNNQRVNPHLQQADALNTRFPTVGKLYTLLFPTTTSSPPILPSLHLPSVAPKPSTVKANRSHEFTLGDKRDVFQASASSQTSHRPQNDERIVRLSAPYDTRPHQSMSTSSKSRKGKFDDHNTARSRRDQPSRIMRELYEPMTDMEVGSESLQAAGIDPDSMATYESTDLVSPNTGEEELTNNKKQENQEVYSPGPSQTESEMSEPSDSQMLQEPHGLYGTRKNSSQEQQQHHHSNHQQQNLEDSPENQLSSMGSEGAEQQTVQQLDVPSEQPLDPEYSQNGQQQQQQVAGNEEIDGQPPQTDDMIQYSPTANMSVEPYRVSENESLTGGMDSYKINGNETLTTAQNDDESFLTAKLPSQYDSVIRMPPEGYYDDYFKPVGNNLAPMQTTADSATSLLNQPENEPEFSLTPPQQPPPRLPERYEFQEGTSNVSKWQRETNGTPQSSRESSSANYVPTTVDYTKQFFMNQKPLKQGDSNVDQNVEFVVPKVQYQQADSNIDTQDTKHQQEPTQLNYDGLANSYDNNSHSGSNFTNNGGAGDHKNQQLRGHTASNSTIMNNEDNIKLIMANTNSVNSSSVDDNEKIINYTSEGLNITRSAEKAPRNTFVNKDMNEFPPGDELLTSEQRPSNAGRFPTKLTRQPQPLSPNLQRQTNRDEQSSRAQQPRQLNLPRSRLLPQIHQQPVTGIVEVGGGVRANEADNEEDLRRTTIDANYGGRFRDNRQRQTQQQYPQLMHADQSQPSDHEARQVARPRERRQRGRYPDQIQVADRSRSTDQTSRTQTLRRPQLTQAHFNPKDLIMNPPTPTPSVTDSALDTITELPTKVRQLREKQPDKNELMNELLTTLDRVKVAIYKLQPLTAKMNAIYRKSITSNTRDIIMDNNKGTYAKRYPPGDYDDSYDRMHPSELLANNAVSARSQQHQDGSLETGESAASAVYLPAPRELLERYERNMSGSQPVELLQGLQLGESRIVATGIGRRLGDGRDFESSFTLFNQTSLNNQSSAGGSLTVESPLSSSSDSSDPNSPLFGYRITIFQTPDEETASSDADQYSYQLEGMTNADTGDSAQVSRVDDGDSMVTSESSVSESTASPTLDTAADQQEDDDVSSGIEPEAEASEAKGKKKEHKQMKEEKSSKGAGAEEADHKESGKKKGEKGKKSESKKKKSEVESKKKKEFKKIKHNKGIVSKEKKTMHRDKHIKAHDRGAAKEKALKERTQIEFFEREQIVDDEYEKAKKSTKKAGWQTGHDSKKTIKDAHGHSEASGEPMSMDASHHIAHHEKDKHLEKSSGVALAASSGKKSNKYEKKAMEASGKKFKGWREKGYKIITETEFIDRGSLHDSAYKKRDKGAAQHHKFKKQQASSEGQHGSMHEHHRKSAKKEEKKEKMHEKKEKHMKKAEKEKEEKKKEKKEKSAKKMDKKKKSYEKTAAASDEQPVKSTSAGDDEDLEESLDQSGSMQSLSRKQQRNLSSQPTLLSASSSTFRPMSLQAPIATAGLGRLLNSNHHHEEPVAVVSPSLNISSFTRNQTTKQDYPPSSRFLLLSDNSQTADDSNRRSDSTPAVKTSALPILNNSDKINSTTVLDIVDNLTGRQVNKTKIGTYELDGEQLHGALRLFANSTLPNQGRRLSKQLYPQQPAQQQQHHHHHHQQQQLTQQPLNQQPSNQQPRQPQNQLLVTSSTRPPQRIAREKSFDLPLLTSLINQAKANLSPPPPPVHEKQQMSRADNNLRHVQVALNSVNIQPTPVPQPNVGYISADRARMAAQFLEQIVQRASTQTGHHQPMNTIANQQGYLPTSERSFALTPQLNPFVAATGPNPFATEQFLDYDSEGPIHLVA